MWRKFSSSYKFIALSFFNILLLFIILNAGIYTYQILRGKFFPPPDPVTEKYGGTLKYVYPQYTIKELRELLHETWNLPLTYEPFVQFKEGSIKGKYVNIDPRGFRISKDQGPWPPEPSHLNIFLFGGSTTFGYSVADHETIASHLQEAFSRLNPAQPVSVYNFGRGNYYSTQERILFEELVRNDAIPNIAIFIDGINENQSGRYGPAHTEALKKFMQRNVFWEIGLFINHLPLIKMIRSRIELLENKRYLRNLKPANEEAANHMLSRVTKTMNSYLHNKRMIEAVGKEYGIQTVFVWQPSPSYRYNTLYHPFREEGFDVRILSDTAYSFIEKLEKSGAFENNFLNCSAIQEDKKKPLYVDAVHYTADMSREFAQKIAAMMFERGLLPKKLMEKTLSQNAAVR